MENVEKIYHLTKDLHELIEQRSNKDDRDKLIEEINKKLEQREDLLQTLPGNHQSQGNELVQKILKLNILVDQGLKQLFGEIKTDIQQLQTKKTVKNKYAGQVISGDGMFFDKRK